MTTKPTILAGDCLEVMATLDAGSIDAIITDLPYGTTACKWDAVIPFAPMWEQVRRVLKPNGVFVTTASQPFTTALIASNLKAFKYCWVWVKNVQTGIGASKYRPMTSHEDIVVFCDGKPTFNKQKTEARHGRKAGGINGRKSNTPTEHLPKMKIRPDPILKQFVNPRTTLEFDVVPRSTGTIHPTQKPVELMRYLIRTYTNPCETVLDPCCGSGTTGVAAMMDGRNCVLIEREEKYLEITRQRLLANH